MPRRIGVYFGFEPGLPAGDISKSVNAVAIISPVGCSPGSSSTVHVGGADGCPSGTPTPLAYRKRTDELAELCSEPARLPILRGSTTRQYSQNKHSQFGVVDST